MEIRARPVHGLIFYRKISCAGATGKEIRWMII